MHQNASDFFKLFNWIYLFIFTLWCVYVWKVYIFWGEKSHVHLRVSGMRWKCLGLHWKIENKILWWSSFDVQVEDKQTSTFRNKVPLPLPSSPSQVSMFWTPCYKEIHHQTVGFHVGFPEPLRDITTERTKLFPFGVMTVFSPLQGQHNPETSSLPHDFMAMHIQPKFHSPCIPS